MSRKAPYLPYVPCKGCSFLCNVASPTRAIIGMAFPFTQNPQYVVNAGKWESPYRVPNCSRCRSLPLRR
jgi:hypothetical protein